MNKSILIVVVCCLTTFSLVAKGLEPPSFPLVDLSSPASVSQFKGTSDQVTLGHSDDAAAAGMTVTVKPGNEGYPGLAMKPEAPLDLSKYGHVDLRVTNTGAKPITVALRVDNAGDWHDNPWSTESTSIKPGATGTVNVIFGYSYGHKKSYALNPAAISAINIFSIKQNDPVSYRIESIVAAGEPGEKPAVDPNSVRIEPTNGVLVGQGVTFDASKQIAVHDKASAAAAGSGVELTFPANAKKASVTIKPPMGRWNVRDSLELKVKLKNTGTAATTVVLRAESNSGPTLDATSPAIATGEEVEVVIPFINPQSAVAIEKTSAAPADPSKAPAKPSWEIKPGTGNVFASNVMNGVAVIPQPSAAEQKIVVESITADMPQADIRDWLGKKPPVEGDWVQTFDDEFDGNKLDETKWNNFGPNYYDKRTHWSKDNLIVSDGAAKLHFEKKTGFQNDDPSTKKETPYACGFMETYGKWVQRYGYFEARMKLPTAPGLWPAFWMMPDRGVAVGEQWKRANTANGGMEFDIMEYLSRWGPNRYNIAMHWDGYQKEHKSIGSEHNYVHPDKDGFITCGLLWTPGSAIYYCEGKEVLRFESPRISTVQSDIMFTMPSGGWDNDDLDDSKLPADFVVDYVRCWQRRDLASEVDTTKIPAK